MPIDSVVRLKQLHQAEVSGYIVDILSKYLKTGTISGISSNTGQLTGAFYPRFSNPSGYVSSGQLAAYATIQNVIDRDLALSSQIDIYYYPRSNPSGYVQLNSITGLVSGIVTGIPDNDKLITGIGGIVTIGSGNYIYVSGSGITLDGECVPWDYFIPSDLSANGFQFFRLADTYSPAIFRFNQGVEYYLQGYRNSYPSENYVIDLYGNQNEFGVATGKPYILGFDVFAGQLTSSGNRVLTTNDLSYLVTFSQLLSTSGSLADDAARLKYELNAQISGAIISGDFTISGAGTSVVYNNGNIIVVSGQGIGEGDLANIVRTTGDQTISGFKSFAQDLELNDPVNSNASFSIRLPTVGAWAQFDTSSAGLSISSHNSRQLMEDVWLRSLTNGTDPQLKPVEHQLTGIWDAGGLTISGRKVVPQLRLSRTIPGEISGAANIGNFTNDHGTHNLGISISIYSDSFSCSKHYHLTTFFNQTNSYWFEATPIFTSGPFGSQDFALDFNAVNSDLYLRIRRKNGTILGLSEVVLTNYCGDMSSVFTNDPITGLVDSIPDLYPLNGLFASNPNFVNVTGNQTISGIKNFAQGLTVSGVPVSTGVGSSYITTGQTGQFASNVNLIATGNTLSIWTGSSTGIFYPRTTNPSGYLTGFNSGLFTLNSNTGSFITSGQTGAFASTVNLSATGSSLSNWTGISTGIYYPRGSNPSGYLTGFNSGLFVLTTNTGNFITTGQTGVFESKWLGAPSDGVYGGVNGAIAGVSIGDTHEDAFDKIEVILGKLAPSKPLNLSQSSFILSGATYSAYMQGTSTSYSNIVNGLKFTGYATGFFDGDNGILSGLINNTLTGQKTLTTGNDIGSFSGLNITRDADFWSGVAGKANFWNYLNAHVAPLTNLSTGLFTAQMGHSISGPTNILSGYCDNPVATSSVWTSSGTGVCTFRYIDGIISFATSDQIRVFFNVSNAISAFYANPIAQITCSQLATSNIAPTGTPLQGSVLSLSGILSVNNSAYTTGASITVTTYNSAGQTTPTATATNFRIDTVSTQPASRATAGTGQFPISNYNLTYNNNTSLATNEELQLINGAIQYPPAVNYGNFIPSGLNYTNLPSGGFSGYRWALFNMGNISNSSNIQITFNSTSNFGASTILSNTLIYATVSGALNGWIDGNTAYPGVGNPTNNNDAALVVGSSSATVKLITFGSVTRSGPVYIRVGFPSGSNKSFGSLSMVAS